MNALTLRPTYAGLLAWIADKAPPEGLTSVRDLPDLALEHLALVLQRYPSAFCDSIAEADPDITALVTDRLGNTARKVSERYAHIGLCVVGFIRAYARELVLRDVQAVIQRNRELDALEDPFTHREVLTPDQELCVELGMGRSLNS